MLDQAIGQAHPCRPQAGVAETGQRPVGTIYFVALIARGKQPRAAGDRLGMGVVFDGSHLARHVAGADDVDARMAQEQQVGRFHEDSCQVLLQAIDLPRLALPVFIERLPDSCQMFAEWIGRGRVAGPGHKSLDRPRLRANLVLVEPLLNPAYAGGANDLGANGTAGDSHGHRPIPEIVIGK